MKLNIEKIGLKELSNEELLIINGGGLNDLTARVVYTVSFAVGAIGGFVVKAANQTAAIATQNTMSPWVAMGSK